MDHAKRSFLRMKERTHTACSAAAPIRPPWSIPEALFLESCSACGECVDACPENVLQKGGGGFPVVDFSDGECTFCQACVDSCVDDALVLSNDSPPWRHVASIADTCLTIRGVSCQSCQDCCEPRAISFTPRIGGPSRPVIESDRCSGCGACVAVCPSNAIDLLEPRLRNNFINKYQVIEK